MRVGCVGMRVCLFGVVVFLERWGDERWGVES